ncbi:MAG TPA: hypothetical protein VK783_00905 [Bacteroidia bacterium]|jgi:hypothetical protein|nr:hypothetical protein [Bacteroidia bacterium]
MKTNTSVSTTKAANPVVLKKVSVNPERHPDRVITRKSAGKLSIKGYELRQWLEHLGSSEGVYFLDSNYDKHSLHYKHHGSGQLMELEQERSNDKEYLEALLFDLSLFPEAPILAFDATKVANELCTMGAIYYEHAKEIDTVVGRLVELDMKSLFGKGVYYEPRINELTIDGIYQVFFSGTSRSFKEQGSYAMYLIYQAIQSIFYQVIGKGAIL